MLDIKDIKSLVEECKMIGTSRVQNKCAEIPEIHIVIAHPPMDFLGAPGNPAIFVNHRTHHLLKNVNREWQVNQTIAIKHDYSKYDALFLIGIIIHEVGHAFNVLTQIPNTEANACIFEIEAMVKLFNLKSHIFKNHTASELLNYFKGRLANYSIAAGAKNLTLIKLIRDIKNDVILSDKNNLVVIELK